MSTLETFAWFVVTPAVVLGIVAIAVSAGGWIKAPKYRLDLPWWAEPVWISGGDLTTAATAPETVEGRACRASW